MGTDATTVLCGLIAALEPDRAKVQEHLERLLAESAESWPAWIDGLKFAEHIGTLLENEAEPLKALERIAAADTFVAAAARFGNPAAAASIEEKIRRLARQVIAKMGGDQAAADEAASEVIERVLVGSKERAPRIGDYKGRGSLAGWLRATISRAYLNTLRKHKREVLIGDDGVLEALDDSHSDPALAHMKSQYRVEFSAAFEDAIASLTDRQRGILRYRFVDGAPIETIATVYRVHRATCHRWISDARAALAKATETHLRKRLAVSELELDAIRAMIESQLELSLSRMFAKE